MSGEVISSFLWRYIKAFLGKDEHFLRKLICLQLPSWALSHPLQVQGLHARCGLGLSALPCAQQEPSLDMQMTLRKQPVCKSGRFRCCNCSACGV